MTKYVVKSLSQILEPSNKHGCLSAARAVGRCFECKSYVSSTGRPCPSRIFSEEYENLLNEKRFLLNALQETERKVKEL